MSRLVNDPTSLRRILVWYFSFYFLINWQQILHFCIFLSRWGVEWTSMGNKMSFLDFSQRLQWNRVKHVKGSEYSPYPLWNNLSVFTSCLYCLQGRSFLNVFSEPFYRITKRWGCRKDLELTCVLGVPIKARAPVWTQPRCIEDPWRSDRPAHFLQLFKSSSSSSSHTTSWAHTHTHTKRSPGALSELRRSTRRCSRRAYTLWRQANKNKSKHFIYSHVGNRGGKQLLTRHNKSLKHLELNCIQKKRINSRLNI